MTFASACRLRLRRAFAAGASLALALVVVSAQAALPLDKLRLPAGFRVELLTDAVPDARQMALGGHDDKSGIVYVGSTSGKVYAVQYGERGTGAVHVVAGGLSVPSGVAWRDGALFIGALGRVLRLDGIDSRLAAPPKPVVVSDRFPADAHHGRRFIAFGPDGKLYVPLGAPCNVCEKPGFGKLIRMNADGSDFQDVAAGIRNTVGFDWQPRTQTLWFTDNGRDLLGDNVPSDELNRVDHPGENFGFPYCFGGDVLDPQFGKGHPCSEFAPPALKLGAHVAPLGMRFYTGTLFPASYRGAIFVAEHGSWNRSSKSGYRVVVVHLNGSKVRDQQPFLTGFLDGQTTLGRPVDVQPLQDGSLLVSDDDNGAIYRISYSHP